MSRPFVVEGPELKILRQVAVPIIDGGQVVQKLGYLVRKPWKMFWATESEIEAKISEIQGSAIPGSGPWVLEGDPSITPIYPPLDLYNVELNFIMYTPT